MGTLVLACDGDRHKDERLLTSRDGGRTWQVRAGCLRQTVGKYAIHPSTVQLADGELLTFLRGPHPIPALVTHDLGVIAGCRGMGLGRVIAPRLPKPHDGVVSVAETHVPGMRDHIVLDVSHTAMLASRAVVRQICTFLQQGTFSRDSIAAT